MKQLLLVFIFVLLTTKTLFAQDSCTLTINFIGLQSNKGALFVGLHATKKSFLKTHFKEAVIKIVNKKASVTFKNLPKGTYAVSAFHDENDNKKLDTNFIGIPKEPIGISNNAKGFMGPPKYKDAKFSIQKNTLINITIK